MSNRLNQFREPQTILLVDDDERVLKFVSRMLGSFGYNDVIPALSSDEALEIWKTRRASIWLIISDFVMPGMTGDLMVAKMLEDQPETKVLFISGNDPGSLASRIPLRPGRNFLQKPFTMIDLRQTVEALSPCHDLRN